MSPVPDHVASPALSRIREKAVVLGSVRLVSLGQRGEAPVGVVGVGPSARLAVRVRDDVEVAVGVEVGRAIELGFPQKESQAVRLFDKARAEGGRYRAQVLAELERRLKR